MNIQLISIGKTGTAYISEGIRLYEQRIVRYNAFRTLEIPDARNAGQLSEAVRKKDEGTALLRHFIPSTSNILLDEGGRQYGSVDFATFLQQSMNQGYKNLHFYIGGPYGFSPEVYEKANGRISLSPMTFTHEMVRLFFCEQLYRAFTIIKKEPYHHR